MHYKSPKSVTYKIGNNRSHTVPNIPPEDDDETVPQQEMKQEFIKIKNSLDEMNEIMIQFHQNIQSHMDDILYPIITHLGLQGMDNLITFMKECKQN